MIGDSGGAASAREIAPELLAGRYRLLALLGIGGMGSVYRAHDGELDEVVALKVLSRDLVGSTEMLDRFRQEVRLARRVTHPRVARMFDIGEHGGERFLTMELVLQVGEEEATAIAQALTVSAVAPLRKAPSNAAVMDLYLRGRHELHKQWPEDLKRAIVLFEEALDQAPSDPVLLASHALALVRLYYHQDDPTLIGRARASAERALVSGHAAAIPWAGAA